MTNPGGINVNINVAANANAAAVVAAVNASLAQLRGNLAGVKQPADGASAALSGLTAKIAEAAVAFAGFQAFKSFVAEGLAFNQTIETAQLGIASLITAQTSMRDGQGALVTGVQKLAVAQELATEQVNKLRIAGLQTTATTEDLVVAFQQAIGVGLRWGLTLDQIRGLTIQMSQAAGALGLPMNQLNEEIRDLLGGNINPRNTRIATALGITNEQIKTAQKAGTLFDFVSTRLQAFSVAGEATAKTFSGVMSNIKEALQNLAGDATKPLFDTLKTAGQAALEDVFDLKNARISQKFAGILDVARTVFKDLGDLLANAIGGAIDGAKELSVWFKENRLEIAETYAAMKLVGEQLQILVSDAIALVIPLTNAAVKAGVIKTVFVGIGLAVAEIHTVLQGLFVVITGIGVAILSSILLPIVGWLRILSKVVSVFNVDLGASIENAANRAAGGIKDMNDGLVDYANNLAAGGNATDVYLAKLKTFEADADKAARAQAHLSQALERAAQSEIEGIAPLDAALKAKTISQTQYAERVTAVKLKSIDAQIAAEKDYLRSLAVGDNLEQKRTLATIANLKARAAAVSKNVTLTPTADPTKDKDSPLKEEHAATIAIKAELKARLDALKILLDNQKISYDAYFAAVKAARLKAVDDEIAALRVLSKSQTDKGALAQTLAQIKALEQSKTQIVADETEKQRLLQLDLDKQVTDAHVQLLRDEGHLADARALEIGQKYQKLIATLKANGDTAGADIVSKLFNIDNAKAKLDELQRSAKVVTDTLAVQLSEINTESTTGAITEAQAREKIVAAYQHARDQLVAMLPLLREQAALTEDPNQVNAVEELAIKIQQMGVTIQQTSDKFLELKKGAHDALESGLGAFLNDAFTGTKSLKDAWIDAAAGIISSLRQIATQMLANLIIQKALEAFGGFFSSGGTVGADVNLPGFAGGGVFRGPGTGTSDSILAHVSTGEGILTARTTARFGGEAFIDMLNAIGENRPVPRARRGSTGYAGGGLVAADAGGGPGARMHATVALEQGLVLSHLESHEGTDVILTVLAKNKNKLRAMLSGG